MASWYRVTKRIGGRLYDYWQRTRRVGKSTKTENKYIGPVGSIVPPTTASAPIFEAQTLSKNERREDERIQYGNLATRVERQQSAVRAAKKKTKGIKAANPFLAQALLKK